MGFLDEVQEQLVREAMASCEDRIDAVLEAVRTYPRQGWVSKEQRVVGVIRALSLLLPQDEAVVMLGVAIERIWMMENFDNDVPRDVAGQ